MSTAAGNARKTRVYSDSGTSPNDDPDYGFEPSAGNNPPFMPLIMPFISPQEPPEEKPKRRSRWLQKQLKQRGWGKK